MRKNLETEMIDVMDGKDNSFTHSGVPERSFSILECY